MDSFTYVYSGGNLSDTQNIANGNFHIIEISETVTVVEANLFQGWNRITAVTGGKNVTTIHDGAFKNCCSISTFLPENTKVTSIGASAFQGCTCLKTFDCFTEATQINDLAFANCQALTSVDVTLCEHLGVGAFCGCSKLIKATLNTTYIPCELFKDCTALSDVSGVVDRVTDIGKRSFYNCTSIQLAPFGKDINVIEASAFEGCTQLLCVEIETPFAIEEKVFKGCTKLHTATFAKGVTCIGKEAFASCSQLKKVQLDSEDVHGTCNVIANNAFSNCSALNTITVPQSVTTIESNAFYACPQLAEVVLPENLRFIGNQTFANCTSLVCCSKATDMAGVQIPSKVEQIGKESFANCSSLASADLAYVLNVGERSFKGCTSLTAAAMTEVSLTDLPNGIFQGCSELLKVAFPKELYKIEPYAFADTRLSECHLPVTVTAIEACAFKGCTQLWNCPIPNATTFIGESAFSGCTALRMVTIHPTIERIGQRAFADCTSLQEVRFDLFNQGLLLGPFVFSGCTQLAIVYLPPLDGEIPAGAFENCSGLRLVTVPSEINTIGQAAFERCPTDLVIFFEGTFEPGVEPLPYLNRFSATKNCTRVVEMYARINSQRHELNIYTCKHGEESTFTATPRPGWEIML